MGKSLSPGLPWAKPASAYSFITATLVPQLLVKYLQTEVKEAIQEL